jgi:uncharacterized membrane protein YjgN (DUF898 family)
LVAIGLIGVIGIAGGFVVAAFGLGMGAAKPGHSSHSVIATLLPLLVYAVIVPVYYGYTQSRNLNEVFEHTSIGPHRLHCTLEAHRLIGIYFTNLVAMICTLGFYTPWAQIRLARYRLECLELEKHGSLDDFVTADSTVPAAVGEEVSSFFDLDFGF